MQVADCPQPLLSVAKSKHPIILFAKSFLSLRAMAPFRTHSRYLYSPFPKGPVVQYPEGVGIVICQCHVFIYRIFIFKEQDPSKIPVLSCVLVRALLLQRDTITTATITKENG